MQIDLNILGKDGGDETLRQMAPPKRKRMFRLCVYLALAVCDCLSLILAVVAAHVINVERFGTPMEGPGIDAFVVLIPIYIAIAADRGLYTSDFFVSWRHNAYRAVKAMAAAVVAVLLIAYYLHATADISRVVLSLGGALAAIMLTGSRWLLYHWAMRVADGEPITTLVVADGLEIAINRTTVVVDAATLRILPRFTHPEMLDRFGSLAKSAERVIVACPPERRAAWAAMLTGANVQGEVVTPELAELGTRRISSFVGQPTLVVSLGPLDTRNRILKRGFDLAVASALIVLIWPLLLIIAVAIKLDSPGSILFRQVRMGRGNRLFRVYKFRSMHAALCDEDGNVSTERGDRRVTRVGRVIRATSLDELPQLLNVLRGDMSIVGPRPHALGSLAGEQLFWHVDDRYWDRHAMKPGITGLAQISGYRGATADASDLEGRLAADRDYMQNWTIWRDVRLLLATASVPFHRNAF